MHADAHPASGLTVRLVMPDGPMTPARIIDWCDRWPEVVAHARVEMAATKHALEAFWDAHADQVVLAKIGHAFLLVHTDEVGESVPYNPTEGVERDG